MSSYEINIFHVKEEKKKGWMIYLITYFISCLIEYKIG